MKEYLPLIFALCLLLSCGEGTPLLDMTEEVYVSKVKFFPPYKKSEVTYPGYYHTYLTGKGKMTDDFEPDYDFDIILVTENRIWDTGTTGTVDDFLNSQYEYVAKRQQPQVVHPEAGDGEVGKDSKVTINVHNDIYSTVRAKVIAHKAKKAIIQFFKDP